MSRWPSPASVALVTITLAVPLLSPVAGGAVTGVVTPAALAPLTAALPVLAGLAVGPPGALAGPVGRLARVRGAGVGPRDGRGESKLAVAAVGLGTLSGGAGLRRVGLHCVVGPASPCFARRGGCFLRRA